MTTIDRFDPFEQRITSAIGEIAAPARPAYLDDVLRQTARTAQRPRWSFPGRWFPTGWAPGHGRARAGMYPLALLVLVALLALATAAILLVGTRPDPLVPGVSNGALVYARDGALYVRSSISAGDDRLLLAPPSGAARGLSAPYLAPDGRTMAFVESRADGDVVYGTTVDLSAPDERPAARLLLDEPIEPGWSQASWSPDSRHLLLTGYFAGGERRLYLVAADGSGARQVVLDGLIPWDAFWSPVDPDLFVLRAQRPGGVQAQGLYLARPDGTIVRSFGLPGQSAFGPQYTLSGAAWSPDGRTIAYNAVVTEPGTFITSFRVHLVDADGTNDRPIAAPADAVINEGWPAWSPDGSQLLVHRWRFATGPDTADASGWIAVAPGDGSAPARDIGPRSEGVQETGVSKMWSPDGRSVIAGFDETGEVFVVNPVTGHATRLQGVTVMPDWQRTPR